LDRTTNPEQFSRATLQKIVKIFSLLVVARSPRQSYRHGSSIEERKTFNKRNIFFTLRLVSNGECETDRQRAREKTEKNLLFACDFCVKLVRTTANNGEKSNHKKK
jgi:hypothetical protein